MLKTVAHDGRADIYRNLRKLVTKPMGALAFVRWLADRTEGKPTQKHEVAVPRVTVFAPADPAAQGASGPPPPPARCRSRWRAGSRRQHSRPER